MATDVDVEDLPLAQRVVLLGLAELERGEETPAHSGQIVRTCTDYLERSDVDALGRLGEAEVSRALNRLEVDGLVDMERADDSSPVGKGRPSYVPEPAAEDLLTSLEADEQLGSLVAALEVQ